MRKGLKVFHQAQPKQSFTSKQGLLLGNLLVHEKHVGSLSPRQPSWRPEQRRVQADDGVTLLKSCHHPLSEGSARAGLTKMVSKLSKEGSFRKGLEVFQALPELGIPPDTAITNSAISACDKGAPRAALPYICKAHC